VISSKQVKGLGGFHRFLTEKGMPSKWNR